MYKNKNTQLKDTINNFITAYSERNDELSFEDWLSQKLSQEIPNLSQESSKKLTSEIIQAVNDYNSTLSELNAAADAGQSKEEWLAEKFEESYIDMPQDTAGEKLTQIEESYISSNIQLMESNEEIPSETTAIVESEPVSWNKYSLKEKAYSIAKQVAMNGLAIVSNALKNKVESGRADINQAVQETFQNGFIHDSTELKEVVSAAVKAASEKGAEKLFPDASTEDICDISSASVDTSNAIFDAASGEITITEALEKSGRAFVASACRMCSRALKKAISVALGPVGPICVEMLGGLFEHMQSSEFFNNVYTTVEGAAKATWKGIKAFGKKIINKLSRREANVLS